MKAKRLQSAKLRSAAFKRTRADHQAEISEDYVELIAELIDEKGEARGTDIAMRLGVANATVVNTLKRLQNQGLVTQEPYRAIFLSVDGWKMANLDAAAEKPVWYRDTGSGMGPALNTAAAMNAYVLADRGTWLSFKNRQNLKIIVEGDAKLFNQYGVILVNPKRHPHVKAEAGQKFINWLVSSEGQETIAGYKIGGEQLFFPNAMKK